jgi:WD40 repeat protein
LSEPSDKGRVLYRHKAHVNSVAFLEDPPLLVSASTDCTVRMWELETEQTLYTLDVGTTPAHEPFFLDGSRLITELGAIDLTDVEPSMFPAS